MIERFPPALRRARRSAVTCRRDHRLIDILMIAISATRGSVTERSSSRLCEALSNPRRPAAAHADWLRRHRLQGVAGTVRRDRRPIALARGLRSSAGAPQPAHGRLGGDQLMPRLPFGIGRLLTRASRQPTGTRAGGRRLQQALGWRADACGRSGIGSRSAATCSAHGRELCPRGGCLPPSVRAVRRRRQRASAATARCLYGRRADQ